MRTKVVRNVLKWAVARLHPRRYRRLKREQRVRRVAVRLHKCGTPKPLRKRVAAKRVGASWLVRVLAWKVE